jgi:hypothetical protein
MGLILNPIILFFALTGAVASLEPKAQFLLANDEALLKLDYATYRGYFNATNEVIQIDLVSRLTSL